MFTSIFRAAVAGDEFALDTLTNWRPRTAAKNLTHSGVKDNHCFYCGSQTGILYYINQAGNCVEVFRSDSSPIIQILWHPKREAIVSLMEDMSLVYFSVNSDGSLVDQDKVKLSGRIPGHTGQISWACNTLSIITGDLSVRIWNIDTSETHLLETRLSDDTSNNFALGVAEIFTCIAYCRENSTLCAGTNQGNLFSWKKSRNVSNEDVWQLSNITTVRGAVKQCLWGICDTTKPCIFLNCVSSCFVLKEQEILSFQSRRVSAVARSATQLYIQNEYGFDFVLTTDYPITNFCINETDLVCTNGRTIYTYKIQKEEQKTPGDKTELKMLIISNGSFTMESRQIFIYDKNIALLNNNEAKIVSLSGVILQELFFNDIEGNNISSLSFNFLKYIHSQSLSSSYNKSF